MLVRKFNLQEKVNNAIKKRTKSIYLPKYPSAAQLSFHFALVYENIVTKKVSFKPRVAVFSRYFSESDIVEKMEKISSVIAF